MAEIGQKVRRLRVFSEVSRRWTRRGAVIGFLAGIVLAPAIAVTWITRCLSRSSGALELADTAGNLAVIFIATPILMPLLFGCVALMLATVVRPVCVAMFCSVERFEQEFGPTRTK
ncbi:MAG TPA: hypothetical protein VH643_36575 [Gemmataceae bacterium]